MPQRSAAQRDEDIDSNQRIVRKLRKDIRRDKTGRAEMG
jgi:hypothetical protein